MDSPKVAAVQVDLPQLGDVHIDHHVAVEIDYPFSRYHGWQQQPIKTAPRPSVDGAGSRENVHHLHRQGHRIEVDRMLEIRRQLGELVPVFFQERIVMEDVNLKLGGSITEHRSQRGGSVLGIGSVLIRKS
nr:hypothetical protein [Paenibacillus sp. AR247]